MYRKLCGWMNRWGGRCIFLGQDRYPSRWVQGMDGGISKLIVGERLHCFWDVHLGQADRVVSVQMDVWRDGGCIT